VSFIAEVGSTFVTVAPSARGFGRQLDSQIGGEVKSSGSRSGKIFGGAMKLTAGAAIGGALALGGFLKGALGEAREAQKVGALTNAVIKSTGGVANVTAKDVDRLSSSLSKKIGVDDESIAAGQNMLLTFGNVRNELGKGNDIFRQATVSASDMAAAFGGDAVSNSKMLGKALNDPTRGVSALTRVGVSFTQQQKDQIKAMQESGDLLGAQKIILGEVRKQTKGAGEASASAGDKAKVAWGNLQETVGTALLPVLDKLQNWFTTKIAPAVTKFVTGMQDGTGAGGDFADKLESLGGTLQSVGSFLVQNRAVVVPLVAAFVSGVAVFKTITSVMRIFTGVQAALNLVMALNPIGLVVLAIAALVAGFIFAYKKSETFRKIVDGAFRGIAAAASFMWEKVIKPVFRFLINTWLTVVGAIVNGAAKAFGWVPGLGPKLKSAAGWFNDFKKEVNAALDGTKDKKTITISTPGADTAISNLATIKRLMHDISTAKPVKVPVQGGIGPLLGGKRALGGPVSAGKTYLVGERGPELFTASQHGRITPNSELGGSGTGAGNTFNIYDRSGDSSRTAREIARQLAFAGGA
jgi:hypothetical protein